MHTALICGDSPADSKLFEKKRKKESCCCVCKKKLVLLFSHGTRVKFLLLQLLLRVQGTRVEIVLHTHSSSCRSVCVRHSCGDCLAHTLLHPPYRSVCVRNSCGDCLAHTQRGVQECVCVRNSCVDCLAHTRGGWVQECVCKELV